MIKEITEEMLTRLEKEEIEQDRLYKKHLSKQKKKKQTLYPNLWRGRSEVDLPNHRRGPTSRRNQL